MSLAEELLADLEELEEEDIIPTDVPAEVNTENITSDKDGNYLYDPLKY